MIADDAVPERNAATENGVGLSRTTIKKNNKQNKKYRNNVEDQKKNIFLTRESISDREGTNEAVASDAAVVTGSFLASLPAYSLSHSGLLGGTESRFALDESGTDVVPAEIIGIQIDPPIPSSPPLKNAQNEVNSSMKKATDASWSSEDYRQAMDAGETNEIIFKSPVKSNASAKVITHSLTQ